MKIQDKVILITGAASGLGAQTAAHLAKLGAQCVCLDVNEEHVISQAKNIGAMGVACDVTNASQTQDVVAQIVKEKKAIHGLVNCAGIAPGERVAGKTGPMPLAHFEKVIAINLVGTFNVLRLVASQMTTQEPVDQDEERGVIINTASIAAFEGQIGQAAYSASKGGVVAMTLPIARELAHFGIRVMTIAPGIMQTPMMSAMPANVQQSLAQQVPFPKRLGKSEEYAQLVQTIMESAYLNASVIRLDAGIRMGEK